MEELEKNILVNELFALYGDLLTQTQQKMIDLYYGMDLSLSEIAEQEGISRNAVHDALKKGIDSLNNYENKLHLYKKITKFNQGLINLKSKLSENDYNLVLKELKEDE